MVSISERTRWALAHPKSASQARLLALITSYANKDGMCWPSRRTLAEIIYGGSSPSQMRQISKTLQALERQGYLTRLEHSRSDGSTTSNRYQLNIPPTGAGIAATSGDGVGNPLALGSEDRGVKQTREEEENDHEAESAGVVFSPPPLLEEASDPTPGRWLSLLIHDFSGLLWDRSPSLERQFKPDIAARAWKGLGATYKSRQLREGLVDFFDERWAYAETAENPVAWLVKVFPRWLDEQQAEGLDSA